VFPGIPSYLRRYLKYFWWRPYFIRSAGGAGALGKNRLGQAAASIRWLRADVTKESFPLSFKMQPAPKKRPQPNAKVRPKFPPL